MTSVSRKSGAPHRPPSILWFTLLCSLLGALWSLNLFPQGPMTFRIQSTVVLNSSRLDVLNEMLNDTHPALQHPACVSLRKVATKELASAHSAQPVATRNQADLPDLHCVTLESEWNQRLSIEEFKAWLATLTEPSAKKLDNTATARELRWIHYKLDLANRYRSADELRPHDPSSSTVPAQTVGFTKQSNSVPSDSTLAVANTTPSSTINVASLQQRAAALQSQLQSERFHLMGTVSVTSLSKWYPFITKDPLIAPMVGLLLGAMAGIGLAYLLRRKPAHSFSTSNNYETTLHELQIPLFRVGAKRELTVTAKPETRSSNHLQWWISGCEWSLLFWGASAAVRFAIDANWRDLSISQPLLALARLFTSV